MKYFLVVFVPAFIPLIFLSNFIFAQEKNSILIGQVDSIYSEALQEQRKIWVYLPESFYTSPESRYPVIYLLDGDIYFYSLSGIVRQLSSFGATACPESIIIAILNTERNRDLMPYDPEDSPYVSSGIEVFTDFLENELIPYVDSKYRTLQYRTLIGHSLGGSFVISTLIDHKHLFTNYLAIDPGLKFHDYRFLHEAIKKIKEGNYHGKSLFLTVANTMPEDMDTLTALKDTTWITSTIRANLQFARTIHGFTGNNLNYEWRYYSNENHLSIPTISQYDGLKYFFAWNSLDLDKILRTMPDISAEKFYNRVIDHYKNVSEKLAFKILPSQEQVNDLGYYFLGKNDLKGAYLFFAFNVNSYSNSSNSYDAMGDFYLAEGQNKKAAEFFKKAINIDGNPQSKEKLKELKTKSRR